MAIIGGMQRTREKLGITLTDATGEEFCAVRIILCCIFQRFDRRLPCVRGRNHKQFEATISATEPWNAKGGAANIILGSLDGVDEIHARTEITQRSRTELC
jgi:hypothetical protein